MKGKSLADTDRRGWRQMGWGAHNITSSRVFAISTSRLVSMSLNMLHFLQNADAAVAEWEHADTAWLGITIDKSMA
jgi:hypothetical protein